MGEFRRFIMGSVAGLEVLFVVASTLLGGIFACIVPAAIANMTGQGGGIALLAFIVGAFGGFCCSALIVGISVSLAQIEENTRAVKALLQEVSTKPYVGAATPQSSQSAAKAEFQFEQSKAINRDSELPFISASKELTEQAQTVLRKAKEHGFELRLISGGKAIGIRKEGLGETICYSNADIERFARFTKWTELK